MWARWFEFSPARHNRIHTLIQSGNMRKNAKMLRNGHFSCLLTSSPLFYPVFRAHLLSTFLPITHTLYLYHIKSSKRGEEVHHIMPLTPENINNPEITLGQNNLILLSKDCHNKNMAGSRKQKSNSTAKEISSLINANYF